MNDLLDLIKKSTIVVKTSTLLSLSITTLLLISSLQALSTPIFNSLGGNFSRDIAVMTQYFDDILESDPVFVDQANMNYRLMTDSPCVDAGTAGNTHRDIQGYIRDVNPI